MHIDDNGPIRPARISSTKVWASLITKVDYLEGLLTLDYSIRQTGSKYPLVALYTDGLEQDGRKALERRGIAMQHVPYLKPSQQVDYSSDPRFYDTWTKLSCFSLTQYDRVVLLDSDMIVMQNIDELMDVPLDPPGYEGRGKQVFAASHACTCNPLKKSHYPKSWTRESCAFTLNEEDPERSQRIGAACDAGVGMINSGAIVLRPSKGAHHAIAEKLKDSEAVSQYIFPDQALLSDVFKGRWVPLPYVYNALRTMRDPGVHDKLWRDDRVKIVHYIITPKPWNVKPGEMKSELFDWWWKVNQQRLDDEKRQDLHK